MKKRAEAYPVNIIVAGLIFAIIFLGGFVMYSLHLSKNNITPDTDLQEDVNEIYQETSSYYDEQKSDLLEPSRRDPELENSIFTRGLKLMSTLASMPGLIGRVISVLSEKVGFFDNRFWDTLLSIAGVIVIGAYAAFLSGRKAEK